MAKQPDGQADTHTGQPVGNASGGSAPGRGGPGVRKWKRFLFVSLYIFLLVAVPATWLIFLKPESFSSWGWPEKVIWAEHKFVIMGVLLIALASIGLGIAGFCYSRLDGDSEGLGSTKKAWRFVFEEGRYAIILGSLTGYLMVAAFLLVPLDTEEAESERISGALPLFVSVVVSFIAIRILYLRAQQDRPIDKLDDLIKLASEDIMKASKSGDEEIWIVYPSPAIGGFTHLRKTSPPHTGTEDMPYNKFRYSVHEARRARRLRTVAYPDSFMDDFWGVYYEDYEKQDDSKKYPLTMSQDEAITQMRRELQDLRPWDNQHFQVHPDIFPQHMIIADNIVYAIVSFGVPVYEKTPGVMDDHEKGEMNGSFTLEMPKKKHRPGAWLIAFRRVDGNLADRLRGQLKSFVESRKVVHGTLDQDVTGTTLGNGAAAADGNDHQGGGPDSTETNS